MQALRKSLPVAAALSPLALVTSAQAALPAGADTLFTETATNFGLVLALAFTAMVVITGGWIVFDMVRKGGKKAAK